MENPKKILFIEDDSDFQNRIKMFFEVEGFLLVSAYDGDSGIKMVEKESPDLILLDLILPKRDGFGVLEEIKKDPKTSKIPVIVLTNMEGAKEIERSFGLGALAYLVKTNYSLDDILGRVKEVLKAFIKKD